VVEHGWAFLLAGMRKRQQEKKDARSVPKGTGQTGRYKNQRQRQRHAESDFSTLRSRSAGSQGESRCGAIHKLHGAVASLAIISHNRRPIMLIRILRVILLLLWLELGLLLILMPWSEVWDVNYFLYQYPGLALFVMNPYLRGMISGLGVMNVLFALEAFRRRTATVVTHT
jgi:hypothetical protein